MIDSVLQGISDSDEVTWQLGASWRDGLPGAVHREMSGSEFRRLCQESDVVVTHAGVGTLMLLLDMGKLPIVYSRDSSKNEHVDDHQNQVASELDRRGLAVKVTGSLDEDALNRASTMAVVRVDDESDESVGSNGR
jgi:UDP-N-acetylglucosamine--N-acetylmuramyl-(pentapeptide) pyrophosphoryl-undecaprenol N-acetylglucosamine transferase